MRRSNLTRSSVRATLFFALLATTASAQLGKRFPSERKVVNDPITGVALTFLTSTPAGDSKIYPTHPQWTADGKWLIFRSSRVPGKAMAVNEESGAIVQVTESNYTGTLCIAQKAMKLFIMRAADPGPSGGSNPAAARRDRSRARFCRQ